MEENIQNFRHVPETNAMRLIQLNLLQRSSRLMLFTWDRLSDFRSIINFMMGLYLFSLLYTYSYCSGVLY
jgi:hypothetical protein